jgi:hypothetical protein
LTSRLTSRASQRRDAGWYSPGTLGPAWLRSAFGGIKRMTKLMRLFLILGIVCFTYGITRWQVMTDVASKQRVQFERFIAAHSNDSTNRITTEEIDGLRRRVRLCMGFHTDWTQAIPSVALAFVLFAMAYYFGEKRN